MPGLLSAKEVRSMVSATDDLKHRAMLLTCYGCGLRVSELVGLHVRDIDGERRLLRFERGKGNKDRDVDLSTATLNLFRRYWSEYRPTAVAVSQRKHTKSVEREYTAKGVLPVQGGCRYQEAQ